ncbi:hypothetical protein AAFF_G00226400 [Aldrovandia affinis]|uniref:Uncharacterized protein n=1 Tax=Aldrovandia affinis TaxID=143900 RepID=A0AAD7TBA7_9TELE|nr:hypothetical protein AAFF_G00226400 [Aldrovandia affinis]
MGNGERPHGPALTILTNKEECVPTTTPNNSPVPACRAAPLHHFLSLAAFTCPRGRRSERKSTASPRPSGGGAVRVFGCGGVSRKQ